MPCSLIIERFILDHSQLKSRRDATSFQIRNIREWFKNNNNPIREEEAEFIEKAGDLIPVVPKEKTPLRRFIDKFDCIRSISCFQLEQREVCTVLSSKATDFPVLTWHQSSMKATMIPKPLYTIKMIGLINS